MDHKLTLNEIADSLIQRSRLEQRSPRFHRQWIQPLLDMDELMDIVSKSLHFTSTAPTETKIAEPIAFVPDPLQKQRPPQPVAERRPAPVPVRDSRFFNIGKDFKIALPPLGSQGGFRTTPVLKPNQRNPLIDAKGKIILE